MHHILLSLILVCCASLGFAADGDAPKALNATTCTICGQPVSKTMAPVEVTYKDADGKEQKALIAVCSDGCKAKIEKSKHPEKLVEAAKADKKAERKKKAE